MGRAQTIVETARRAARRAFGQLTSATRFTGRAIMPACLAVFRLAESPRFFAGLATAGLAVVAISHAPSLLPTAALIQYQKLLETSAAGSLPTPPVDDEAGTLVREELTAAPLQSAGRADLDTVQPRTDAMLPANAQAEGPTKTPESATKTTEWVLRRGESVVNLLARAGLERQQRHLVANALGDHADMRRIKPGQRITLSRNAADGTLAAIDLEEDFASLVRAKPVGDGFVAQRKSLPTLAVTRLVEGSIDDSLYLSARAEGLPPTVLAELIRMMSYSVDFQRDIWRGDRFSVYFERLAEPGSGAIKDGRILAAKLELRNRQHEAIWFERPGGKGGYFNAAGESVRKALLLTPVDGARLTSGYGRRRHPILGYNRLHRGLDFGAPRGTPIMAGGDGVVERANRYGGYGNYIRIRHGGGLKTAYAHLSKFAKGIRKGARVSQGQIIGYVGTTGRSTGPHLHYEILRGDRQINPNTLKMPPGEVLAGASMDRFKGLSARLSADIATIRDSQALLASDAPPSLLIADGRAARRFDENASPARSTPQRLAPASSQ